ncbi:VOC family protein [Microlunatus sp. Gsoil 973]|uniref:VOC family protein n=1 Tax=Microlunatus sp. Gsoil 973 TaxID=2672569 RepID=UPI00351B6E72
MESRSHDRTPQPTLPIRHRRRRPGRRRRILVRSARRHTRAATGSQRCGLPTTSPTRRRDPNSPSAHARSEDQKERMHLDIETDDVEAEVSRLERLGAKRWDHQQERGFDFWALRDPWGNELCVLQTVFPHLLAERPPWPANPLARHQ